MYVFVLLYIPVYPFGIYINTSYYTYINAVWQIKAMYIYDLM